MQSSHSTAPDRDLTLLLTLIILSFSWTTSVEKINYIHIIVETTIHVYIIRNYNYTFLIIGK